MENEPIRVAHILGKMVGGGVESFIMNYYRNIDRTKIQFDFIIDSDSTVVPRDEIESLGGKIIEIPPYQKIFKYIKVLKKVLKENNYKIVHSHLNSLSVFPLYCAWSDKIPVRIAHSHSTTNKKEWKKNIIKNILKPFSKVFATDYFACSEHAGRWLFGNKTFENGKVNIIHNAIEVDKFKYNEEIRNKIRRELNIEDKFVLGHVGRFVEQKNHIFLLNLLEKILKIKKNVNLLLIGNGPLEKNILNLAKEKEIDNHILFLGAIDNVNEYMNAMDCFVFPSLYEGLGIVAIEAQVNGLNVYASNYVPSETKIMNTMKYLSLDRIDEWVVNIINNQNNNLKNRNVIDKEEVSLNGYDINVETKKIEEIYIKKVKNK